MTREKRRERQRRWRQPVAPEGINMAVLIGVTRLICQSLTARMTSASYLGRLASVSTLAPLVAAIDRTWQHRAGRNGTEWGGMGRNGAEWGGMGCREQGAR